MEASLKAILIISYIRVQVSFRFWQNLTDTRCSVFSVILNATTTQTLLFFFILRWQRELEKLEWGYQV
jgi:hypothetical protein